MLKNVPNFVFSIANVICRMAIRDDMFFECNLCISEFERIKQSFDDDISSIEAYFPVRDVVARGYSPNTRLCVT